MKKLLIILIIFRINYPLWAQDKLFDFSVGYNVSFLKEIPEHFQLVNLGYQQKYNTTREFALDPYARGFYIGFRFNLNEYMSLDYSIYRKVAYSDIAYFPDKEKYGQYRMFYGNNSVGFIIGKQEKPLRFGINCDFGNVLWKKKFYPKDEFKKGKWVDYVETIKVFSKGPTYLGVNIYVLYHWKFLETRLYYTFGSREDYPDYTNWTDYVVKTSNYGLAVYLFLTRLKE